MTCFNIGVNGNECGGSHSGSLKDECVIALKVYDFCRHLKCNYIQLDF